MMSLGVKPDWPAEVEGCSGAGGGVGPPLLPEPTWGVCWTGAVEFAVIDISDTLCLRTTLVWVSVVARGMFSGATWTGLTTLTLSLFASLAVGTEALLEPPSDDTLFLGVLNASLTLVPTEAKDIKPPPRAVNPMPAMAIVLLSVSVPATARPKPAAVTTPPATANTMPMPAGGKANMKATPTTAPIRANPTFCHFSRKFCLGSFMGSMTGGSGSLSPGESSSAALSQ